MKIPPWAQPDAVLMLTGEGLPRLARRSRGDLFVP
jgi:hypothetical protein